MYVQDRIGVAIKNKLGGSIDLERKLGAILESIGTGSTGVQFSELENMVSMMIFQGKKHLMRDFESKIKDLSQVTGSYGNLTVVEVPQV